MNKWQCMNYILTLVPVSQWFLDEYFISLSQYLPFCNFLRYIKKEILYLYWGYPYLDWMHNLTEKTTFQYRNTEIFKREHNQILNCLALIVNAIWVKGGTISTSEFKRDSKQALRFGCWKGKEVDVIRRMNNLRQMSVEFFFFWVIYSVSFH